MKSKKIRSLRYQIVFYSLLSLLYSVLTVIAIGVMGSIIYVAVGGDAGNTMGRPLVRMVMNSFEYEKAQQTTQMMNQSSTSTLEIAQEEKNHSNLSSSSEVNKDKIEGKQIAPIKEKSYGKEMMASGGNDATIVNLVLLLMMFLLTIVLFILYFLKFTQKFGDQMGLIADGINEIARGNFNAPIMLDSPDEFGDVADKINHMAEDLENILQKNQKNEQRKNELITSVAHDLRTPLTSILGYLDLVKKPNLEPEVREKYIKIAYTKSKRLEQLIEDLFSYTQYTEGKVDALQNQVDVVKLIEQLVDEFYPSFQEHQLEYEFQKDCNSLITVADGNLLARAFANLIGNAIKYGKDGKRVEISLTHSQDKMNLTIKNYGEIIPKKDLAYIFERFYRVESSRSVKTGGTGLGLAIAKRIVEIHQGEITADSDLSGTVFRVTLPIQKELKNREKQEEIIKLAQEGGRREDA